MQRTKAPQLEELFLKKNIFINFHKNSQQAGEVVS